MITKWNAEIPIPTDSDYSARITGASFSPSKGSGNPMITLNWEMVSPATKMVGDKEVSLTGIKLKDTYHTTKVLDGTEVVADKTEAARARVFVSNNPDQPSLWEKLKLDGAKEDPENPNVKQLIGKVVLVQCSSESIEDRATPTSEELTKAKKNNIHPSKAGRILKNPLTGKDRVKHWPKIDEIFGVAPKEGY